MAILDYTSILGKRVKITLSYPDDVLPPYNVFGVIVGFVDFASGYKHFSCLNEVLFLQDGFDEPNFVVFSSLELIN